MLIRVDLEHPASVCFVELDLFFFSSRRRHTRCLSDWSSDVCSSDLGAVEVIEKGEQDFLYLNDGKGRFAPVSWTAGGFLDEDGKPLTAPPTDWGLSVTFRDINDDGLPDIYVCNDFFYWPDRIWISDKARRFRAIPRLAVRNQSLSSMAVDFADIDRDGYDDFFVAEMLNRDHQARQRHRENLIHKQWNLP